MEKVLEKKIAQLERENEQLKKDLIENESDCEMCNFPKLYKRCFELLKTLYENAESGNSTFYEVCNDVEQFIKENL